MNILLGIGIYILIGYLFICRLAYRQGAELYIPGPFRNMYCDGLGITVAIMFMPMVLAIYIIYRIFNVISRIHNTYIPNTLTPDSFYKKGEIANNADIQVEKHLLGGK